MPSTIVVHVRAAGGATRDITVTMPTPRTPKARIGGVRGAPIAAVHTWTGTRWSGP